MSTYTINNYNCRQQNHFGENRRNRTRSRSRDANRNGGQSSDIDYRESGVNMRLFAAQMDEHSRRRRTVGDEHRVTAASRDNDYRGLNYQGGQEAGWAGSETDGSALSNGRGNAKGGYGVVCESDRSLDRAGSYTHGEQTNNRYELEAIKHGTEVARGVNHDNFKIHSDSKYAIDSLNKWTHNWKQNGWTTSSGQPVANQDLIKTIDRNVSELRASGKNIGFEHVRGHQDNYHNNEADRLARGAANANRVDETGETHYRYH